MRGWAGRPRSAKRTRSEHVAAEALAHALALAELAVERADLVAVATFTAPLYLAEVAPVRIRGAMISTYQLMITIGILVAFLSDTAFSYSGNWRWMLGVIAIPGALFLLGVLLLPDSPLWLMMADARLKPSLC
jgi:MFS family permease